LSPIRLAGNARRPVVAGSRRVDTRHTMGAAPATDSDESDETQMLAYAGGSSMAFEQLYARHRGGTYRYLLRHTGNPATAEELHQEVWLSVVRARDSWSRQARFATWLYTIARNRLVDHWRARRGAKLVSLDDEGVESAVDAALMADRNETGPLSLTMHVESGQRLVAALEGIPPAQRDAFLLHVEGGLGLREIAALSGASIETVKSRLRYAYGRLRTALEDLQ
jgi:RNA polymerase sigma factor (sigma-70 family)